MTIKFLQAVTIEVPLDPSSGGTGIDNGSFTLSLGGNTIISTGGTIALGGFTVTILDTGAAVLNDNAATAGHVGFFSNAFRLNNDANFFWDNTNKRLGIGNAAPSEKLHVTGKVRATTGLILDTLDLQSILFTNSATKQVESSSSFYFDETNLVMHLGGTGTIATLPRIAIKGVDSNGVTGPHFATYSSVDIYPLMHWLSYTHDNMELSFDCYYDGAAAVFKSSDAGSNFQIRKNGDRFGIWSDSGVAQGSTITLAEILTTDVNGNWRFTGALHSRKNSTDYSVYGFHPLTAPLTSTSFDGDAFSTTAKTLIDTSSVFGAPAGIKAALVTVQVRDSASTTSDSLLVLGPTNTSLVGMITPAADGVNDRFVRATHVVPCDANGDFYYQVVASGASTFDVHLQIWGYWI